LLLHPGAIYIIEVLLPDSLAAARLYHCTLAHLNFYFTQATAVEFFGDDLGLKWILVTQEQKRKSYSSTLSSGNRSSSRTLTKQLLQKDPAVADDGAEHQPATSQKLTTCVVFCLWRYQKTILITPTMHHPCFH
jgi:hypothetical protein